MRVFLIFGLCFLLYQCRTENKQVNVKNTEEIFQTFFSRFDEDTVFQKSRIRYNFKKKIDLSVSKIDTSLFRISILNSDSVIVKTTYRKDTTYWIKFTFKKDSGKWYFYNYVDSYND